MTTSRVDQQLRDEAARFCLRFGRKSYAHFAPETWARCSGYPTAPHRGIDLERLESLELCKDFEVV